MSGPIFCDPFCLRIAPDRITYVWNLGGHSKIFYYETGLWIQALADLYALTGSTRHRKRAEAMVSYLCGNNPWRVRIFNKLGGVYNWTEDTNGDGVQDSLRLDMYPESTTFCQIGIMHLMRAIIETEHHKIKPL